MLQSIIDFFCKKEVYGLILIILVGYLAYHFGIKLIESVINKNKNDFERKRRITIVRLLTYTIKLVVYCFVIFFILDLYGVNTKGIIASLGVASALLSLSLQDTLKDIISGIDIIINNYFVVGDYVTYNDFTGEVIEMSLKTTKIKKYNGEVLVIANRNIDEVINLSQKKANIIIKIPTAYEEKTSKVEKSINTILSEIKNNTNAYETKYLGIEELADSSVNYAISIICKSEEQWQIKRDALKIIKENYEKSNIKIPYSQIEVHHE